MKASSKTVIPPAKLVPSAILLLAALFRFAGLGTVRHSYDNAYQIYDALRLLDASQWLLIGQPSSVFLDNPPLMAYLLSVPLLIWRSPWSAYLFVTALNTLAVLFVYSLARELKGTLFAVLAATLFAVNPWLVHYSRFTWTQGLLPFFLALAAWGIWPAFVAARPASPRLLLGLLAVAAMIQTYVLALTILAPLLLLLAIFRRRLPRRPLVAGLLVIFLPLLAYGAGLSTRLQPNLEKVTRFVAADQERPLGLNAESLQHTVRLVTGFEFQAPGETAPFPQSLTVLTTVAHLLLATSLVAGAVCALLALRRPGRDRRLAVILIIWTFLPTLGFALLPLAVHPHYLLLTLPGGQFLAAWGLSALAGARRLRLLLAPLLLALILIFGWSLQTAATIAANNPAPSDDLQHWTLSAAARLGREVRQAVLAGQPPAAPYPRRVSAPANTILISSASATYLQVVPDLAYPDYVMLAAQEPLLYILVNRQTYPGALGNREEPLAQQTPIPGGPTLSLIRAPAYESAQALALPQTALDWRSEAGLTLLGYDLAAAPPSAGENLHLTTYWRVDDLSPHRAEWYVGAYYQILNQDWQTLVNESGNGQWARRWQLGDIYIERVALPLPQEAGEYRLLLGLHDPIHAQNYALLSPEGPQQFITMPLFSASP